MVDYGSRRLPVSFSANRLYVEPITESGSQLRLYTDTGGGLFLTRSAVDRLGLSVTILRNGGTCRQIVALPTMREDGWIPPVSISHDPRPPEYRGHLFVTEDSDRNAGFGDGMLGQIWFGGRIWTIDYLARSLRIQPSEAVSGLDRLHSVELGFPSDREGRRATHFPSVFASVYGESYAFLFDTGATVCLSTAALAELGDGGPAARGTSFIVASVFDRWRRQHPSWQVIDGADTGCQGAPIIEVPEVTIAGYEVGPVWFTRRADREFHDWMSSMMDRRVDGALGGSLFQYFAITVDYPGARAYFACS